MTRARDDRLRAASPGDPGPRAGQRRWTSGPAIPMAVTMLSFLVGYLQKLPCYATAWRREPHVRFSEFCYSDISILFRQRRLIDGYFPYRIDSWRHPLEYPVVTGLVMDWTARLTRSVAPGASRLVASRIYYDLNVLVLLTCALVVVGATWAALRRCGVSGRPAVLVAAAPSLALAGTINWDLIAVACATCALLAWLYERPVLAGALIGLGTAAKLYPALLIWPMALLCLRNRSLLTLVKLTASAIVVWAAVNIPIAVLFPAGWLEFWRFNAERGADYGSMWHALVVSGYDLDFEALNQVAGGLLVLAFVGVAALALLARRPPTVGQLALLTVAAFLVTNKVYSPQYVLWLLPLIVLARAHAPCRRAIGFWALWQVAEFGYWIAIWRFFTHPPESQAWQYPTAVVIRIAVTLAICAVVVVDCLRSLDSAESPDQAEPLALDGGGPGPESRRLPRDTVAVDAS